MSIQLGLFEPNPTQAKTIDEELDEEFAVLHFLSNDDKPT